ncbi:aldolase/citrate lyase family protein [Thermorudis peleae]|uniref:aldolase/citrate lyase family protein n=1 Tax=Thermorudis peleae TaxID=1382356 RepID=UPI00069213C3|nr:aldolase/citrate lyase family protein [Thermorudis peleae]
MGAQTSTGEQGYDAAVRQLAAVLHRALRAESGAGPREARFRDDTQAVRQADWCVALPPSLARQQVTLLVPAGDATALVRGLASGADTVLLDFDDTFAPSLQNLRRGWAHLATLSVRQPGMPLIMVRPRPAWLQDQTVYVDGEPACAAAVDVAYYLTAVASHGSAWLYLPKVATMEEACAWDQALTAAEQALAWQPNAVRVIVQIECLSAIFQADEILWALRNRALGLNAGRWDYCASVIRSLGRVLPPLPARDQLTSQTPFLAAYLRQLTRVCQRRKALAIGGVANLATDERARAVLAEKQWEAQLGFHGAWAGHPEAVPLVRQAYHAVTSMVPAVPAARGDESTIAQQLCTLPTIASLPVAALQRALNKLAAWLRAWQAGNALVVHDGEFEDLSTAEVTRAQLWQWRWHRVQLDDGDWLTEERFQTECQSVGDAALSRLLAELTADTAIDHPLPSLVSPGEGALT